MSLDIEKDRSAIRSLLDSVPVRELEAVKVEDDAKDEHIPEGN